MLRVGNNRYPAGGPKENSIGADGVGGAAGCGRHTVTAATIAALVIKASTANIIRDRPVVAGMVGG
jgi:hypothetical protein